MAQPDQPGWVADDARLRLQERERATDDHAPTAVAWSGVLVRRPPQPVDQLLLRCVAGRPVSAVTTDCLAGCSTRLAAQGITGLVLIGDTAAWHPSQHVRRWIRAHTREVKRTGHGVRCIPCCLPRKSPWLNPIAPTWLHGKRAVSEPARALSADELEQRVCADYGGDREAHVTMPEKVA